MQNRECGSSGVTCTKEVSVSITENTETVTFTLIKDRSITRNGAVIRIPYVDSSVGMMLICGFKTAVLNR